MTESMDIDVSLDDIISSRKKAQGQGGGTGTGGQSRGRGRSRGDGGGRFNRGRSSFWSRPATRGSSPNGVWRHDKFQESETRVTFNEQQQRERYSGSGSKVTIVNLDYGVSDNDILELFEEFGILYASVLYDRSGNSTGKADVVFSGQYEAQAAIDKYNNVVLDGRRMIMHLVESSGNSMQQIYSRRHDHDGNESNLRRVQRSISRNRDGGNYFRGQGQRGHGGNRGRGRGRSFGSGRGSGGIQGSKLIPSTEELDAELDAYISKNHID